MINQWLDDHLLSYTFVAENIFEITNVGKFLVVREKDVVFDERFALNLDDDEFEEEVDFYCYKFGESYFYIHIFPCLYQPWNADYGYSPFVR